LSGDKVVTNGKIITQLEFQQLREGFRIQGRQVAHCHGVFDLLHPGHIAYLEEAKSLADILVVSVTAASYVNRGPGRPFFTDALRMQSLAALSCVDYVLLVDAPTAIEIIEIVKPNYYVKGQEYAVASDDVTGNIVHEVEKVRHYGGDVYFTTGVVFSSTKLINQNFPVFPPGVKEFVQEFVRKYTFDDIRKIIDSLNELKVLVIGDIIIDEYIFCNVQGLMSKDRAFSSQYNHEERYLGGTLAIARHLASFSKNVTVCGIVGTEPHKIHSQIVNDLGRTVKVDLQVDKKFRTVVKRRFVERHGVRDEYAKLFSVNYLPDSQQEAGIDREGFNESLKRKIGDYDVVVVADYGHGLMDSTTMEIIQDKATFLALNCQTNSSNYGTNLITKYRRADIFTLDERELNLACANRTNEPGVLLSQLMIHFNNSRAGWATLGSLGSICMTGKHISRTPALTLSVQDTVGAGDAFFSLASLCARVGAPAEATSFIANIAGALAANILGNSRAVTKAELLKFATTLLKI